MRHFNKIIFLSITAIAVLIIVPFGFSSDPNSYFADNNTCVVYPSGVDDTSNLVFAFETVSKNGLSGTVKLLEGTYYISSEVIVANFDGVFTGAGMYQTIIRTNGSELWPHRDLENFYDIASLFLFYRTDNLSYNLEITDMSVHVFGETSEYNTMTGMNVFDVKGKVNGDKTTFEESEVNLFIRRVHFEGEVIDSWHTYNVINTINLGGETIITDNWYFKPLSGIQVIEDCSFKQVGAAMKINSLNGNVIVKNNNIEAVLFGIWFADAGHLANNSRSLIYGNTITNSVLDPIRIDKFENCLVSNNKIMGSVASNGITIVDSVNNYVTSNLISGCNVSGISLMGSPGNVVYNNSLIENGEDMTWDGVGSSLWIDNTYETKSETIVTPAEELISEFEDEISELVSAANLMEQGLEDAAEQVNSLEEEVEQSSEEIAVLETELSARNNEVSLLESKSATSLSYFSVAGIVILVAIIVWIIARKNSS